MRWDEMRWEIRWDEMRWDAMRCDEMRWDDEISHNYTESGEWLYVPTEAYVNCKWQICFNRNMPDYFEVIILSHFTGASAIIHASDLSCLRMIWRFVSMFLFVEQLIVPRSIEYICMKWYSSWYSRQHCHDHRYFEDQLIESRNCL